MTPLPGRLSVAVVVFLLPHEGRELANGHRNGESEFVAISELCDLVTEGHFHAERVTDPGRTRPLAASRADCLAIVRRVKPETTSMPSQMGRFSWCTTIPSP
jgi:hypothetical protein